MDVAVRVEPGAALPLTGPQADSASVGGGAAAKAGIPLARYIDVQAGAGAYALGGKGAVSTQSTPGAFTLGGGLRAMRPHDLGRIAPWADVDLLYVRTGPLDRSGFAAAGGVSVPIGREHAAWAGPFVRYMQIVQPEKNGFDNTDAKLLVIGVGGELGGGEDPDRDHDGVANDEDRCPNVAGAVSNGGCPIVDSDGDGVVDRDDRCPSVAGPRENAGCAWPDGDGDGVIDRDDACPHDRGLATNKGCPVVDADHDGVPDKEDRCPNEVGTINGCPDPDGDGLVPPDDQCPFAPGNKDDKGCPKYKQIVVTAEKIELNQKIFFAFGKAQILSKSFALLNEVAQALRDNPSLRIRIEGHTDSTGNAKQNKALSQGRADAVLEFLATQNVARDRMSAQGFGSEVPLDTNRTAEGRERNRRVEFVMVDDKGNAVAPTAPKAGGAK